MIDYSTMSNEQLDALAAERIFGLQLNAATREQIARAVFSGMRSSNGRGQANFEWNGTEYRDLALIPSPEIRDTNWRYGWSLWVQRESCEYRADIEAHVAAWRDNCPSPTTDPRDRDALVEAMERAGYLVSMSRPDRSGWLVTFTGVDAYIYRRADTLGRAVVLAALAAVENGEEG